MERRTDHSWVGLQHEVLPVAAAVSFVGDAGAGGINVFVGTTRQWTDGRETTYLAYEAYETMALDEMQRLVDEAFERWPLCKACLLHRLGEVPVGEASVVVAVAAPHRDQAYAASRYLIDTLKEDVPIWKKETYTDGTAAWVEGDPSREGADRA